MLSELQMAAPTQEVLHHGLFTLDKLDPPGLIS